MASIDDIIQLLADELGIDTDDVKIKINEDDNEVTIKIKHEDASDLFDEDIDFNSQDDDEGDAATEAVALPVG